MGKILLRISDWIRSESSWLVYRLDTTAFHAESNAALIRREVDFETLQKLGYFKAISLPELIQARFAAGARCHGFFLDGSLVNLAWTTAGRLDVELGLSIEDSQAIGIFDCLTMPAHRSKGFYTQSLVLLIKLIRESGFGAALICVDPDNPASIKGIERAGFEPLYCMKRLRRFGRDSFEKRPFELRMVAQDDKRPRDFTKSGLSEKR